MPAGEPILTNKKVRANFGETCIKGEEYVFPFEKSLGFEYFTGFNEQHKLIFFQP